MSKVPTGASVMRLTGFSIAGISGIGERLAWERRASTGSGRMFIDCSRVVHTWFMGGSWVVDNSRPRMKGLMDGWTVDTSLRPHTIRSNAKLT